MVRTGGGGAPPPPRTQAPTPTPGPCQSTVMTIRLLMQYRTAILPLLLPRGRRLGPRSRPRPLLRTSPIRLERPSPWTRPPGYASSTSVALGLTAAWPPVWAWGWELAGLGPLARATLAQIGLHLHRWSAHRFPSRGPLLKKAVAFIPLAVPPHPLPSLHTLHLLLCRKPRSSRVPHHPCHRVGSPLWAPSQALGACIRRLLHPLLTTLKPLGPPTHLQGTTPLDTQGRLSSIYPPRRHYRTPLMLPGWATGRRSYPSPNIRNAQAISPQACVCCGRTCTGIRPLSCIPPWGPRPTPCPIPGL